MESPSEKAQKHEELETGLSTDSKPEAAVPNLNLRCSISHQILTLVGFAFVCFEILFLILYFDAFWFALDLSSLGVIAILVICVIAHCLLLLLETNRACRLFAFIGQGKAPVTYRQWIGLEPGGIRFGIRHIRWEAIDELELSWFGNLIIKSRSLCGDGQPAPDIVLKIPFGVADNTAQQTFLNAARSQRPNVIMNNRLLKVGTAVTAKGAQATQLATAMIMSVILLDVGHASFYYLEMMKNLYLAELSAVQEADTATANLPLEKTISEKTRWEKVKSELNRADELRTHPLPISWVSSKFLSSSTVAAGIYIQRARVLSLMGKDAEALENIEKASEHAPNNLRHSLFKTRLLVSSGKAEEARATLDETIKKRESALLPRLYVLALSKSQEKQSLDKEYENQLAACYAESFGDEPHWPPGGNRFFTELWFSDDLRFLMNRFLESKPDMERVKTEAKKKLESDASK